MSENRPLVALGGLWKKSGEKGDFLSGKFGMGSILIFPNRNKRGPQDPDYMMYIAESPRRENTGGGQNPNWRNRESFGSPASPPAPGTPSGFTPPGSDDIPF